MKEFFLILAFISGGFILSAATIAPVEGWLRSYSFQEKAKSPEVQRLRNERLNGKSEEEPFFKRVAKWLSAVFEDSPMEVAMNLQAADPATLSKVATAILKLVPANKNWRQDTKCSGTHQECVVQLAGLFMMNSHGIDPLLIVAMARLESNLTAFGPDGTAIKSRPDPNNGKVDVGIIQVRDWWKKGCDSMDTVADQISCGAGFYAKQYFHNGRSLFRGLNAYTCGNPNTSSTTVRNFVVAIRVILWQALVAEASAETLKDIISGVGKTVRTTHNFADWGEYKKFYRNQSPEV